jgi:AcrR family transcriptional regulator
MKRRRAFEPVKTPSQERSRATVEAILQAATYILIESGYGVFTTNAVAHRAGVNIATLYQYFPNKESIFAELARRHVEEARAAIAAAIVSRRGSGLEAVVRASVDATIAAHKVAPALHRILTEEAPRLGLPPIEATADDALTSEQTAAVAHLRHVVPDPELALWIVETAVHALVHVAAVERPRDLSRPLFAEEITQLVTRYLGRKRSSRRSTRAASKRSL